MFHNCLIWGYLLANIVKRIGLVPLGILKAASQCADNPHGICKGGYSAGSLLPEACVLLAVVLARERGVADDA